jgi:8-oxo-dGTP pyrophosphatase MutT (NUDIX family)
VGFPHLTHDVPGADEALARLAASAAVDPLGHGALLAEALRAGGTSHEGDRGEERAARGRTPAGHLCATAWVLDPSGTSTLLVRHRSLGWVEPGGHLERGEDPARAAARELREETGIDAVPVLPHPAVVHAGPFPARGSEPAHHHWNLGYLFVVDRSVATRAEPGAPVAWFDLDQLPSPAVADLPVVLPAVRDLLGRLDPPVTP